MICENCGKEHSGDFGSGRFCSKKCAKSFSTKSINHKETKNAKCIICGKEIMIPKNASSKNCKCNDCKNNYKQCTICGRLKVNGICENEFCKQHNPQHFKNLIKYFGFDKRKYGTIEVENEFNRIRELLYDLYWDKNLSSTQLAKLFNYKSCPTNITQKFFKQYLNIPIKSCKYATKENYFENRLTISESKNSCYKHGWHTTWNNKEVYYRSQNELDYAIELDNKQIDYEMEFLHIKYYDTQLNEYRCAIPDFYIPSRNEIVEIKSVYTLDIQNMKDKFKSYKELGYNCKCICDYKELVI